MIYNENRSVLENWGPLLLPTVFVVLFNLFHLMMPTPTAGGLSVLAAVLIAYFFFPKLRIRLPRILLAIMLALGVAILMGLAL